MCSHCESLHDAHSDAHTAQETRKPRVIQTHEALIAAVHELALTHPSLSAQDKVLLKSVKLTYGSGPDGVRGVTYYKLWQSGNTSKGKKGKTIPSAPQYAPFVAICATGQSDHVQVLGTTLHELGHVIAGHAAAHGPDWHAACERLGLVGIQAAGTAYTWDNFDAFIRPLLKALPEPKDGKPVNMFGALPPGIVPGLGVPQLPRKLKPCTFGRGSRGGVSRGTGSGSRQLKYSCGCTIVRASAGAQLDATCNKCGRKFVLDGASLPPAQKAKAQTAPKPTGKPQGKPKSPKASPKPKPQAKAKAKAQPKRPPKPTGKAAAARSAAVNAPLPNAQPADPGDALAQILQRIDPK